jgi:purine-binding chemotaxis protein CheW
MLVTFDVAGQEFALDLESVQEILPAPATLVAVPHAETLVLGVTSLRDRLLPLLSLRGLLGFPAKAGSDGREKVVVMRVGGALVGLVADRARAILAARSSAIDPIPSVLAARTGGEARIRAIYRGEEGRRLVSILMPEQLFREDVMRRLGQGGQKDSSQAARGESRQSSEAQFLVFRLGKDEFGLPIDSVDEVGEVPAQITKLPKTPKFLEGVVNLRGDVLPVIDQRRRFDLPVISDSDRRRLVVVRSERHRAGLIVDGVTDVLRVAAGSVEPAPELTEQIARLVRGVINLEHSQRMVLVLDPAELLTPAERGRLDAFQKANRANA